MFAKYVIPTGNIADAPIPRDIRMMLALVLAAREPTTEVVEAMLRAILAFYEKPEIDKSEDPAWFDAVIATMRALAREDAEAIVRDCAKAAATRAIRQDPNAPLTHAESCCITHAKEQGAAAVAACVKQILKVRGGRKPSDWNDDDIAPHCDRASVPSARGVGK